MQGFPDLLPPWVMPTTLREVIADKMTTEPPQRFHQLRGSAIGEAMRALSVGGFDFDVVGIAKIGRPQLIGSEVRPVQSPGGCGGTLSAVLVNEDLDPVACEM